jgi:hypothetical protein
MSPSFQFPLIKGTSSGGYGCFGGCPNTYCGAGDMHAQSVTPASGNPNRTSTVPALAG